MFNAIAKAKREAIVVTEDGSVASNKDKAGSVDGGDNDSISSAGTSRTADMRSKLAAKAAAGRKGFENSSAKSAAGNKNSNGGAGTSNNSSSGGGGAKWAALRDDYMLGSTLSVKVMHMIVIMNELTYFIDYFDDIVIVVR